MREETKTFIARVLKYNSSATNPALAPTLEATIDNLKNPSCSIPVDPERLDHLKSLLSVKFRIPKGSLTQSELEGILAGLTAALKDCEEGDAKYALYDLIADLKSHEWDETGEIWGVDWKKMMCWIVALVSIVEGWGIGFEVLGEFIGEGEETEKYVEELRNVIESAYEVRGLIMMDDLSRGPGILGP
ncbi:hypothetical protein HBI53_236380 [Parastagonospora nodorum]|nr:hypothetical protein HBI53_236380 [Parastagonospora nodorum]KAH6552747.1 hypothetical protein HBI07_020080 [Parastagonospora nodorum]